MNHLSETFLVADLNNTAANKWIIEKNYEAAISTLSKALKASRRIMIEEQSRPCAPLPTTLDQCMMRCTTSKCEEMSEDNDDTKTAYLCRTPILIPPEISQGQGGYRSHVLCSIIAIYNLALSHHLAAEDSCDRNRRVSLLKNAEKLYQLANELHNQEGFSSVVFILVSMNNMGLIYKELQEDKTAKLCFQQLLATVVFLIDCGERNTISLDGFMRNIAQVIYVNEIIAAPAA